MVFSCSNITYRGAVLFKRTVPSEIILWYALICSKCRLYSISTKISNLQFVLVKMVYSNYKFNYTDAALISHTALADFTTEYCSLIITLNHNLNKTMSPRIYDWKPAFIYYITYLTYFNRFVCRYALTLYIYSCVSSFTFGLIFVHIHLRSRVER